MWEQTEYDPTTAQYPTKTVTETVTIPGTTTTYTVTRNVQVAPGESLLDSVDAGEVGTNIRSLFVGSTVTACDGDCAMTLIVVQDDDGNITYRCDAPPSDDSDDQKYIGKQFTLKYYNGNLRLCNSEVSTRTDGMTEHFITDLYDASGKHYQIVPSDGNMRLRDDNGQVYSINSDGRIYDKNGSATTSNTQTVTDTVTTTTPARTVTVSNVIVDTDGTPVYDAVFELKGTGDGSNAVRLAALFNMNDDTRFTTDPLGTLCINNYYGNAMTQLGSDAESTNMKIEAQEEVMLQIEEWRQSTSGVNWNEELTNMLKFQQGFSACSRCLTTMDEMLDRLINSTGMVGR